MLLLGWVVIRSYVIVFVWDVQHSNFQSCLQLSEYNSTTCAALGSSIQSYKGLPDRGWRLGVIKYLYELHVAYK